MILDTNALSALFDGDDALIEVLRHLDRQTIPAVVLGEYRFGVLRSRHARRLGRALDELESEAVILDITASTARLYARTRHRLREAGTPIPENDIWIGALGLEHRLPVVSRDEHLDRIGGLQRIPW